MSKTFMYDLYCGNIVPWERKRPQNPVYNPISLKIGDYKEYFKELISPEEYEKFDEMEDLTVQARTIEDVDLFEYGFCMGALMMFDVFSFRDSHLTEQESQQQR